MRSLFASATGDQTNGDVILKVVNGAYEAQPVDIHVAGAPIPDGPAASAVILTSANAMDENSLDEPEEVSPKPVPLTVKGGHIQQVLPANSFLVVRLKTRK
jgi:alpha-L-arabinofuranosidase